MRMHRTLPAFQISRSGATDRRIALPATGAGARPTIQPRARMMKVAAAMRALKRFASALEAHEDFSSAVCPLL